MEDIAALLTAKKLLLDRKIPESYPPCVRALGEVDLFTNKVSREYFIPISAFPLISYDWIRPLAQYIGNRPCLEIMAGTGMLSKALQDCGVQITATDNFLWKKTHWFDKEKQPWCDVEDIDCIEAIQKYSNVPFVVCSWPYMDDTAYQALNTMREVNPSCKMIYIGEDTGGCTASKKFFDAAEIDPDIENKEFTRARRAYKSWRDVHDQIYLLR